MLQSRAGNGIIEAPPTAAGAKKNWAKDFDADNVSQLVVSIAQAAGIYACIMARAVASLPSRCHARTHTADPCVCVFPPCHPTTPGQPAVRVRAAAVPRDAGGPGAARVHHLRELPRPHALQQGCAHAVARGHPLCMRSRRVQL
jgi:hypothetical protein